ncbi:Peptidoglycan binding-like domain protein, partial [mine drainage metagenome]
MLKFKSDASLGSQTGLVPSSNVGNGTFAAFWLYTFAGGRDIQTGRNGFDVVFLQSTLQNLGRYTGCIDGHYGPKTRSAVMALQFDSGIVVDGVVGPQTFYQIGVRQSVASPLPMPTI